MTTSSPNKPNTKVCCHHCGDDCPNDSHQLDGKSFCCAGCLTVYQLIKTNDLGAFYANGAVGQKGSTVSESDLDFLDDPAVLSAFLKFSDDKYGRVDLKIPSIHCSSCVYLLERLPKLNSGVKRSEVNFPKKTLSILFDQHQIPLKELVALLIRIGFDPELDLAKLDEKKENPRTDRNLLYKLGVAGFCFGNIMLFSFPEYLSGLGLDHSYAKFFNWINLVLAIPVLFYSASDYLMSAFKGLRIGRVNMDVPVSLGILAIFIRSTIDIVGGAGPGFMDSLSGFVFFLLIGKWYQAKTYSALSFERDYKSFFPIAVRKFSEFGQPTSTLIKDLKKDDEIQIRNGELIPADAILISDSAKIDYSFVTGEADPISLFKGGQVFAGGRQRGSMIKLKVLKPVSSSYLTSLWSQGQNDHENKVDQLSDLSDRVAGYFSLAVVSIAVITAVYWGINDPSKWLNAVSSVLIIACPCALALSIPFTYGTLMRFFGRNGLYVRSIRSIGTLAGVDLAVFDKTGTITIKNDQSEFEGDLSENELVAVVNLARQSTHPLSRNLAEAHPDLPELKVVDYQEEAGVGLSGMVGHLSIKLGKPEFVGATEDENSNSGFSVGIEGLPKGRFQFGNHYRPGLRNVISKLNESMPVSVISGDNDSEERELRSIFGKQADLRFKMDPHEKRTWIGDRQKEGKHVMMIGDGLNDSGALKEAEFGVSVADDVHQFTPASDAILQADSFEKLPAFHLLSKDGRTIVKAAFALSLIYNIVGVSVAVQGILTPIFAAIFMPLSSVTIVLFTSLASSMASRSRLS